MKKLLLTSFLWFILHGTYAGSADITLSNPLLAQIFASVMTDQDSEQEPWDIAALHAVLRDSDLYKLLMTMHITVPSTAKTGEYVLMYNEVHQINQNLELIRQELQKLNDKLDKNGP